MGSNSRGDRGDHQEHQEEPQHAIQIWEAKKDLIASMHKKISTPPKLLSKSAGHSNCSIFRVPQSLIDTNGRAYQPHVVSIGPFHHGQPHLRMIEEHKWRFLGALLTRTQAKGLTLEDYLTAVQPLESRARECYSETINFDSDEFLQILLLDGCFIIELFRKIGKVVPVEADDPLITMSWVYSFLLRDFIRLENQIPFFVLQQLFDLSTMPGEESGPSLFKLTLEFFNNATQRPDKVLRNYENTRGRHLLDFLRSSFIPIGRGSDEEEEEKQGNSVPDHVIRSISKLRRAGISLDPGNDQDTFLVVKFRCGMIEMPTISIDDFMSCFMTNCVAFEQCQRNCSKYFTTYATLLDCLINTAKDVEFLSDRNIVENYFGTDTELAKFINNLGKDVTFDIEKCYLSKLFHDVNEYYKNGWHVQWASFRYTYFSSPWSFISALAAFVLLVLSVAQTYYTMLGYIRPPK